VNVLYKEKYLDTISHFPEKISQELADYVTEFVLFKSRYLFTRRVVGMQKAYCTHCKKESMTDGLKHNQEYKCPNCDSNCVVKASGRGRKKLYDDAYLVWYEKSIQNPEAIVARGIYLSRDYSSDYHAIETKYFVKAYYLFEPGNSRMLFHDWGGLSQRKNVKSEFNTSMGHKSCHVDKANIEKAVKSTPFQYSTWESYFHTTSYMRASTDMVEFFDLASKYPCIEYLTKLGAKDAVEAKLYGRKTYNTINWRGKTIYKVLRLTKAELKQLTMSKLKSIDVQLLSCYQFFKKNKVYIDFQEADQLKELTSWYIDDLNKLLKLTTLSKISKYFLKQLRNHKKHYGSAHSVLWAFRDYLRDCKDLGMDINQEHVLFPNNLYAAHQKTIRQVKIKEDRTLNVKISRRLKDLQKYSFQSSGLFIRPVESSIELFDEGKALNHCVGRYAADYAAGKTNLFVIRKESDPEKPFYTVEIIKDRVTQVYGMGNCRPTKEVKAFMEAFTAIKLTKKPKERKVAV
jgi:PcfJ-like protein